MIDYSILKQIKMKFQKPQENNFKAIVKKVFLGLIVISTTTLFAQSEGKTKKVIVPTEVKAAFAKEFPAKKANWEMEDSNYEAEFRMNGNDASALYDTKGHQKALEIAINKEELPANVMLYLKKNYPSNKITETAKITDDKKEITYEVEIKKERKLYDVLFNSKGAFLKIVTGD